MASEHAILALLQGLLRELLHLTGSNKEQRRQVLLAYGESLQQRNMFEDAAAAFLAAGALPEALRAYQLGGQWRMVFAVAGGVLKSCFSDLAAAAHLVPRRVLCTFTSSCMQGSCSSAARGAEGIAGLPRHVAAALAGRVHILFSHLGCSCILGSLWDIFVFSHHCSSFACSWRRWGP